MLWNYEVGFSRHFLWKMNQTLTLPRTQTQKINTRTTSFIRIISNKSLAWTSMSSWITVHHPIQIRIRYVQRRNNHVKEDQTLPRNISIHSSVPALPCPNRTIFVNSICISRVYIRKVFSANEKWNVIIKRKMLRSSAQRTVLLVGLNGIILVIFNFEHVFILLNLTTIMKLEYSDNLTKWSVL